MTAFTFTIQIIIIKKLDLNKNIVKQERREFKNLNVLQQNNLEAAKAIFFLQLLNCNAAHHFPLIAVPGTVFLIILAELVPVL